MNVPLLVAGAARTHPGCVREANEDSAIARPELGLWAVADGMGGHAHGEWASACVAGALDELAGNEDFDALLGNVADAIHAANARVVAEGRARSTQMGSTVAALLVRAPRFGVVWVGDSRVYLLRDAVLHQLTADHTQVQELVERGLLTPEDARGHPMGHVLTRAVGVDDALELDAMTDTVLPGDLFLLCSDGLTCVVADDEIGETLGACRPAEAVERLIALCLARGAPDNVTIAVVEVGVSTLLVFMRDQDPTP